MQEGDRWFRTGNCWCRKVITVARGSLLHEGCRWRRTGSCWCRKVVAAGVELIAVRAGRWLLPQKGGRLKRAGSCFCMDMVAGVGVVVAAAEKWSPMQEGSCWCRLKGY